MRLRLLVAGLLVAIAALTIVIGPDRTRSRPLGPLWSADDASTMTGVAADVGDTVAVGVSVRVPGSPENMITLDRASLLEAPDGLGLVSIVVSTGREDGSFTCVGSDRRFPPPGCRVFPLRGWVVNDEAIEHGSFQLVIGLRADQAGIFGFPAVALDYHDADGAYRAVFLQGAQVCAPREAYGVGCPGTEAIVARQEELAAQLV